MPGESFDRGLRGAVFDILEEGGFEPSGEECAPVDYGSEIKHGMGGFVDILRGELINGKLGNRVLDFGSGIREKDQVGRLLQKEAKRFKKEDIKVGLVDFRLPDKKERAGLFTLNLDMLAVGENGPEIARAVKSAAEMFGIQDLGEPPVDVTEFKEWLKGLKQVDTMIFSDLLNYVDYKQLLSLVYLFLKDNGRFFVFNRVGHGVKSLFSDRRPNSTEELVSFLKEELEMEIDDCSRLFHYPGSVAGDFVDRTEDLSSRRGGASYRDLIVACKQKDFLLHDK